MASGPVVEATLGLDTTSFQRGLARANSAAAGFKGSVERLGLTSVLGPLTQGAGAGIVVGALVMGLRSAVQEAMRMREEAERTGVAIDDTTASAARLGDSFAAVSAGLRGVGIRVAAEIQTTLEDSFGRDAPIWRSLIQGGGVAGLLFRKVFSEAQDATDARTEEQLLRKVGDLNKRIDDERSAYLREQLNTEQLMEDVQGRITEAKKQQAQIDQTSTEGRRRYLQIELEIVSLSREEQRLFLRSETERKRADEQREASARRLRDIERDIAALRSRQASAQARAQAFAQGRGDPAGRAPLRSAEQIAAEGSGGFRSSEPQRGARAFLDESERNQLRFQRELRSVGAGPGPNASQYEIEQFNRNVARVREQNEQAERNFKARQDDIEDRASRRVPEMGEQRRRDAATAQQEASVFGDQLERLTEIRDALTGANTAT